TTDIKKAVSDADFIIVAVPTKALREVLGQAVPFIAKKAVFVHVSQGIEPDSLLRISEIMEEEIPGDVRTDIVVLSG
ncbi:glycerol-3-phosphate dehydrogenase, partial [Bacillus vallismortis]|nr:glycerol-3-phosphate dehydrogenase [Bacillus vallismortis]